jgi:hypothetical protein
MTRLSRWLLRLYPRAWRDRYEDEVIALLDESAVSVRQLWDLASGACVEWVHVLLAPRTSAALLEHRPVMWLFRASVVLGPVAIGLAVCRATATAILHATQPEVPLGMVIAAVCVLPLQFFGVVRLYRSAPVGDTPPKRPIGRAELWMWVVLFLIGGTGQNVLILTAFSGAFSSGSAGWWYLREFSLLFSVPLLDFLMVMPRFIAPWFRRVTGRPLFASRPAPNVPATPLGLDL